MDYAKRLAIEVHIDAECYFFRDGGSPLSRGNSSEFSSIFELKLPFGRAHWAIAEQNASRLSRIAAMTRSQYIEDGYVVLDVTSLLMLNRIADAIRRNFRQLATLCVASIWLS